MRKAVSVLALLLAGACRQFAPPHVVPELPVPQTYPPDVATETAGARATEIAWREFFVDERLETLIAAALEQNRDLAITVAQIEQARGLYRIQDANRVPSIDADASATVGRSGGETLDRYSIGVGVSAFELDFWGRVRNLSEAARAEYLATVQGQRAFRLVVIREVASAYLFSLEAAERIELAEATVRSREEGLEIAQVRMESGITSALEYRQAESLLTQAQTELAGLRLAKARNDNALSALVGGPVPSALPDAVPLVQQATAPTIAAGLPSELLTARPDIIAAEERLRASRADIGAARAAFFPSISLTGSFGFASADLGDLLGSDGLTWNIGPFISLPIFNRGRLEGNLTVAQANESIATASYERTIQTAFREVADALAGRRYLAEQVAAQERGTRAQREIAALARTRYLEGVVGYLEVLDAERNLFGAEQALLQLRRAQADNLVSLYIALGGGSTE
ncbi:MAG TPA: efflux transporter outer membrane subunit [Thermoanaerobaculia bacterium]|nr:efflux transporter outer membrane subunit [Thermoanaerobaculia bacterium]